MTTETPPAQTASLYSKFIASSQTFSGNKELMISLEASVIAAAVFNPLSLSILNMATGDRIWLSTVLGALVYLVIVYWRMKRAKSTMPPEIIVQQ